MSAKDFLKVRKTAIRKADVLSYSEADDAFGGSSVEVVLTQGVRIKIPGCDIVKFENALFDRPDATL